jgi:hypothetical protein
MQPVMPPKASVPKPQLLKIGPGIIGRATYGPQFGGHYYCRIFERARGKVLAATSLPSTLEEADAWLTAQWREIMTNTSAKARNG